MIHFNEFFLEELSSSNIKKIEDYVNNENIEIILPKIKQACKEAELIGDHFKQYFKNKGLDNKSFDNDPELGFRIGSIFAKNEQNTILKDIVKNNGVITFDELTKGSNIFDFCKDFLESAKTISKIINVTSHNANVGKFEILLKFMLKENGVSHSHGDVAIDYKGGFGLEIKGGDKAETSARICGQTVLSTKEMCKYFLELFDIKSEDVSFLGSGSANTRFAKVLNDNDIKDIDKIIENYVKAFAYQYQIKENDKCIDKMIDALQKYNKDQNIFKLEDNKIVIERLTNINGVVQLYFYSNKDKWDGIFVVNQLNGDYQIIKADEIIDFEKTINKIIFKDLEGNSQATGRRCVSRVFPKK